MKKIAIIGIGLIIVIIFLILQVNHHQQQIRQVQSFNATYEGYQNREWYGIDVMTVINKAMDNNTQYQIPKDDKGMYVDDGQYSIKVELELIEDTDQTTGENKFITTQMESLQKVGLEGFITNFNLTTFSCKTIEYHPKTGRVSKMIFRQIEP